jgi:hypothetical protein
LNVLVWRVALAFLLYDNSLNVCVCSFVFASQEFKGVELASLVHGLGSLQVFPRQELLVPLVAQIEATLHECNAQGQSTIHTINLDMTFSYMANAEESLYINVWSSGLPNIPN